MVQHDQFSEDLMELEQALVRQFRTLQSLIELTQKEREAILKDEDKLMNLVEEKEAILDQLGVIEDRRRGLVQDLALALKVTGETTSVIDLLPHLNPNSATSIARLVDGITTLANHARELNRANQAIAYVRMDWLRATQTFLIGMVQPDPDYRPAMAAPVRRDAAGLGLEVRA